METPNQRLKAARIKAGYKSATAFAEAAGIVEATYRHHENATGGRGIPSSKLALYAEKLNVSVEWLLTGRLGPDPMQLESSCRPEASLVIRLSHAEICALEPPFNKAVEKLARSQNRERVLVPEVAKNAAAMEMPDDSMSRVIPPNTELVVDFDDTELKDGKPYLIRIGDNSMVRCFREGQGVNRFEADSFQMSYEPIEAQAVEHILGRIVCSVKRY